VVASLSEMRDKSLGESGAPRSVRTRRHAPRSVVTLRSSPSVREPATANIVRWGCSC